MYKRTEHDIKYHPSWVLDEAEKVLQNIQKISAANDIIQGEKYDSIVSLIVIYLGKINWPAYHTLYHSWYLANIGLYSTLKNSLKSTITVIEQDGEIYNI